MNSSVQQTARARDSAKGHSIIIENGGSSNLNQPAPGIPGVDIKVTQPPEVGKQLTVAHPLWRQEWGISAGEN